MKVQIIIHVLTVCLITTSIQGSAIQFAKMVNSKSIFTAPKYMGYGNYCGVGGKGRPQDGIDRCCAEHDRCIKIANRKTCLPFAIFTYYMLPYSWFMVKDNIYCAKTNSSCAWAYCNCDRQCAECFSRHDHRYNRKLKRGIL